MSPDLSAKRVQILTETFPKLRRIGVLHNPRDSASVGQLSFAEQAVRTLRRELMTVEAGALEEFGAALAKLVAWRADALVMMNCNLYWTHRKTLLSVATKNRWATINSAKEYLDAGALLSYGPNLADNCYRSADYVDRILKGAKPADLPVQQPTTFELVINLKAAKAMGLSIPQSMLIRAHEVIE